MSLHLHCPHCGLRPIDEFLYGDLPSVPDSIEGDDARNLDLAFMQTNAEGPVVERWFHALGCRRWSTYTRDTRTGG